MIFCNFPILDECIKLGPKGTLLLIEDIRIYSQVVYSIYQRENGIQPNYPFLLFDENFKEVAEPVTIYHPLLFDLNSASLKKKLFQRITMMLDLDEKLEVERIYNELTQYLNHKIFENLEIKVDISESCKLEDVFKLLKIAISDSSTSIFEKSQLILNLLKEFSTPNLVIFVGLGSLITREEFLFMIETINLNQQKVLFLENRPLENLKNIKQIHLDTDLVSWEKML